MKKIYFIILILSLPFSSFSEDSKVLGTRFFKESFGHLHKTPDKDSPSITGIMCGTRLRLLTHKDLEKNSDWIYVELGEDKGFIKIDFTSLNRPHDYREMDEVGDVCFQGAYPKFYSSLNLNVSDQYYWGKLLDRFTYGESKVPVGESK